jgi:hypothetical protein
VRGDAGHGCDLRAEFLCPKESPTAEAAAHIEHVTAEIKLRLPNFRSVMKHPFLGCYNAFTQFQERKIKRSCLVDDPSMIVQSWPRPIPPQQIQCLGLIIVHDFGDRHT